MSRTKLGIITLLFLAGTVAVSHLSNSGLSILGVKKLEFDFGKTRSDAKLDGIVRENIREIEGSFAVYIEELPSSPSATLENPKRYALNKQESFPAASLYKLVLLAAIFKEIEEGRLKMEDRISAAKAHLEEVFGGVDFGYEEAPEQISYTVDEALTRVGRISDNFAAIMLTEKLRSITRGGDPLKVIVQELGMKNTSFDPPNTTASDLALFFRKLYSGQVISPQSSEQIIKYLSLSQLNNRIPAGLPKEVKVVHKTGELARARHDVGIVYGKNPYLIVLLSKDLKYEDEGVEVLTGISKEVYNYFAQKQ